MIRPPRPLEYVVALLLLLIPAAFLTANLRRLDERAAPPSALERVVLRVSAPIQSAVAWVIGGASSLWSRYVWLVDVERENRELVVENHKLQRLLAESRNQAAHASELEELVQVRARSPAETLGARVVGVGLSGQVRAARLVLDRGDAEVAPNMAVISSQGVVGRIARVYGGYADVQLAVDAESSIDVLVPRTRVRGILKGRGVESGYRAELDYLRNTDEIVPGDLVVTSGLGGSFPPDVPVGVILSVEKTTYGLYQKVLVAPTVDFTRVRSVLVILAPPPPPDPTARAKKSPAPAQSLGPPVR